MFGFNWEEHKMRQKTDQKFYLGSWGGKFSLLLFAKAESATILFSPFQNTWVESGQLTWNLCCINMSKYVTATGPKKWGSTHAACSCPPPPTLDVGTVECRRTSEPTLDNGECGCHVVRSPEGIGMWRKARCENYNRICDCTSTCLLVPFSRNIKNIRESNSQTQCSRSVWAADRRRRECVWGSWRQLAGLSKVVRD